MYWQFIRKKGIPYASEMRRDVFSFVLTVHFFIICPFKKIINTYAMKIRYGYNDVRRDAPCSVFIVGIRALT